MKITRGFTFIELLLVISIIGLLSSIVMASINDSRERARITAGQKFAAHIEHSNLKMVDWDFETISDTTVYDQAGNINGTIVNATIQDGYKKQQGSLF